jgi:hypothetical protein
MCPGAQWVIDSVTSPDKKEEVKEKQLEALKRLGHSGLVLDEYESVYTYHLAPSHKSLIILQGKWRTK